MAQMGRPGLFLTHANHPFFGEYVGGDVPAIGDNRNSGLKNFDQSYAAR
jgi:hypothetical protein